MLNIEFLENPSLKTLEKNWLDGAVQSEKFEINAREPQYAPIYNNKKNGISVAYYKDYEILKYDEEFEPATLIAKQDNEIIGFYTGNQCWVDEDHRFQGLGKALIVVAICTHKELPLAHKESIGMSQAGYETHLAAMTEINTFAKNNMAANKKTKKPIAEVWTEQRTQALIDMAKSGKYSYIEMAKNLGDGLTKNAIAGKLSRLGIKLTNFTNDQLKTKEAKKPKVIASQTITPNSPIEEKTEKHTRKKEAKKTIKHLFKKTEPKVVERSGLDLLTPDELEDYNEIQGLKPLIFSIIDLKNDSCREPYIGSKNKSIFYCGRECSKKINHLYCTEHAKKNLQLK